MAARANDHILHAHRTVNQTIANLENLSDPLEIDGLVLRLDYLIRSLVNHDDNNPRMDEILRFLGEACDQLTSEAEEMQRQVIEFPPIVPPQILTQRRGRPSFDIKQEQLTSLLESGFKVPTIAQLLRVSTRTVERRMNQYGLSVSSELQTFKYCIPLQSEYTCKTSWP